MSKVVMILYYFSHYLYRKNIPVLPKVITYIIRILFSGWIPAEAKIGKHVRLGKGGLGIVIHEQAIIGDNCIISHNVTLGGASLKQKGKLPVIGNRVRIGCGAVILGDVHIGDNSIVAANSVVTSHVEANSIVAGNPATVVKTDIDINEYVEI